MTRRPRNTSEQLLPAIKSTLDALVMAEEDAGIARLAEAYAREIDDSPAEMRAEALEKLGPRLLAALEHLAATPKARGAIAKRPPTGSNPLTKLQEARGA